MNDGTIEMDETDTELAIDRIFRAVYGAQQHGGDMYSVVAGLIQCKEELERRGWKWQPDDNPSVIKDIDAGNKS